jgi:hypothetical protein
VAVAGVDRLDLGGLELGGRRLVAQEGAELAVVECRERPGEAVADGVLGRVDDERVEGLADRASEGEVLEPLGRCGAGGGLPLADLVAVDDQNLGAGALELASDGQAGETGAADEHVAVAVEGRARGAPLCGPDRHYADDTEARGESRSGVAALRFGQCRH